MAERDTTTEELRCILTADEITAKAKALAQLTEKHDEVDEHRRRTAKRLKETIDGLKADIRETAEAISNGWELRDIECRLVSDYDAGVVRTIRMDTGAEVRNRPMSDPERQLQITFSPVEEEHTHVLGAGTQRCACGWTPEDMPEEPAEASEA